MSDVSVTMAIELRPDLANPERQLLRFASFQGLRDAQRQGTFRTWPFRKRFSWRSWVTVTTPSPWK
jgi:hypothetical protein